MDQYLSDAALRTFDAGVREHGFFAWGAAQAGEVEDRDRYLGYLAAGRHAAMDYLERTHAVRCDPRRLLPGARTVITVLRSYAWPPPPVPAGHGRVAAYARGLDYHQVMRKDLRAVARRIEGYRSRVFVDTGPLLERFWARKAGVASLGKNTCCLRRDAGSTFFIGVIVTDAPFPPTRHRAEDICGECHACLDACPTGALTAPYVLDARRCLSYLTIEHRGSLPRSFHAAMGDVLFGCDRCQDACPYNQSSTIRGHPAFQPRPPFAAPNPADLLAWGETAFQALAQDRPVERATWRGLRRNVLVAAANMGRSDLLRRFLARPDLPDLTELARELLGSR